MSSTTRRVVLALGGVLLGVLLGGPYAASALSTYGVFPVPNPILVTPVVGLLVYWWTRGIRELLALLALVALVAAAFVVAVLSAPVYVLEATAGGSAAVYQTAVFNAIASLLPAVPVVALAAAFASVLDTETGLPAAYHPRGDLTRRLVAATLGLAVVAAAVAGAVGANYASAARQSQADVTVLGVDDSEDRLRVGVRVPNRLTSGMLVRSIVLDIRLDGSRTVRVSYLARTTVPPGEVGTFAVPVDREELSPAAYRDADVRITGVVRVAAFRGYETTLRVEPYEP